MLTFPDGTQSGVFGLNEILAAVYSEGMAVNADTADVIVERLAIKNYIAPSVRQRYRDVVIEEYGRYVAIRESSNPKQEVLPGSLPNAGRVTGLLPRLFRRRRSGPT